MSSDAKLGLVVGLILVLTIGLVFYKREPVRPLGEPGMPSTSARIPNPDNPDPFGPAAEPPPLPAN